MMIKNNIFRILNKVCAGFFVLLLTQSGCQKAFPTDPNPTFPTLMDKTISQENAIEIAVHICSDGKISTNEPITNIHGEITTFEDVMKRFEEENYDAHFTHQSDILVWLISMDGTFVVSRPPDPNSNQLPTPVVLSHCAIAINAKNGSPIYETARGIVP
jgi:hypothetical protein